MAAWSKVCVSERSFAGIAGSNPAEGMDVSLLCVLCVVRVESLRQADPRPEQSYRLCVFVSLCVINSPLHL